MTWKGIPLQGVAQFKIFFKFVPQVSAFSQQTLSFKGHIRKVLTFINLHSHWNPTMPSQLDQFIQHLEQIVQQLQMLEALFASSVLEDRNSICRESSLQKEDI
ncbi:hypothetical protein H6G89_16705 [Oscillatoria sp. FACHB-1407]|nr:hypothetical protein [Oscillatoria sp. FACHB-1407]